MQLLLRGIGVEKLEKFEGIHTAAFLLWSLPVQLLSLPFLDKGKVRRLITVVISDLRVKWRCGRGGGRGDQPMYTLSKISLPGPLE